MEHDSDERSIGSRRLRPESLMMSYGYRPEWSEGSLKCPIYQTSTFVFRSAEEGKAFFEVAYGLRKKGAQEKLGLIYSRLNNPDGEILEDRLTLFDEAEAAVVFESGMAAISTALLELLRPGDLLLHSEPLYGGTDYFIRHVLARFGVRRLGFPAGADRAAVEKLLDAVESPERLALIFVETPANPTNQLVDMAACVELARARSTPGRRVLVAVDNTFLGPLWQHPLTLGADLVLYSATKFLGGHSDVIAGACLGSKELIERVRGLRTFLGTGAGPWTGWLLLRSLETLKLRMTCQMKNAERLADWLADHPKIERVYYPGRLEPGGRDEAVYRRQCLAPGSMISFDLRGGEKEAFRFLNALKLIRLAVSLGGTESLAEHPATMTHADIPADEQARTGITPRMIRLSVGVEHPGDLQADLEQALDQV